MDFLNKAFTQFNDFFRSMSPSGRITAGLLLIVAVVSVGYLFQSQVGGGDEYLFGGMAIEGPTLQKMELAFGKAGLKGYELEGSRMKVPRAKRDDYLAALASEKLFPQNFGDRMKEAAEGGLTDLPNQREQKWTLSTELEMSAEMRKWKGIQDASVIIKSRPPTGLGQRASTTAGVTAEAIGGNPLDEEQVDKIRFYVAGAAGMNPEDVTIADANGRVYRPGDPEHGGLDGDPYAHAVRKAEDAWNDKIRRALIDITGVNVSSTVVLDHEKESRTVEVKNDPTKLPLKSMDYSRPVYPNAAAVGGAPGFRTQQGGGANQPANLASTGEPGEETKNELTNGVSTTSTEKASDGRAVKSVKVAIGIPATYFEKLWQINNPPKAGEEAKKPDQTALDEIRKAIIKDVTTHVATLLPPSPGVSDPSTLVTVTPFQDIKPPEIVGPGLPQRTFTWLTDNWPMLAMVVLVLVSVGMLRSVLRAVPAASPEASAIAARIPASESKAEEKEEPVEAAAARRLRRMSGSGPSLRDELSEIVKEDPDSAANILRTWIGQVT